MKKLNKITLERAAVIEGRELADASSLAGEGRLVDAACAWVAAAGVGYALGRPFAEVRARLEAGARAFAEAARAGSVEADQLVPFDFWCFHGICTWAGCADAPPLVPRERWSDEEGSAVPGLREVLDLLLARQGGADVTDALGAEKGRAWKQPFGRRVAQPLAALHHALLVGDAAAFQASLAGVVDGHVYMVRGELQYSTRGLLCLGLLGPLRTAVRQGLRFELDTPYLPLELVRA